jgi:hypothetical protein
LNTDEVTLQKVLTHSKIPNINTEHINTSTHRGCLNFIVNSLNIVIARAVGCDTFVPGLIPLISIQRCSAERYRGTDFLSTVPVNVKR